MKLTRILLKIYTALTFSFLKISHFNILFSFSFQNTFRTPVYTTSKRRSAMGIGLVFEADLPTKVHANRWVLEGVCLTLNDDWKKKLNLVISFCVGFSFDVTIKSKFFEVYTLEFSFPHCRKVYKRIKEGKIFSLAASTKKWELENEREKIFLWNGKSIIMAKSDKL